jgi:hypothetical protein
VGDVGVRVCAGRASGGAVLRTAALSRYEQLTQVSKRTLLAMHGVGPESVGILEEQLQQRGWRTRLLADRQRLRPGAGPLRAHECGVRRRQSEHFGLSERDPAHFVVLGRPRLAHDRDRDELDQERRAGIPALE